MGKSLLTRVLGFPATLIHGDTLVLDRWQWLKERLPITRNGERLIDIGCGSGAFSIGATLRGYTSLGLSWDERNQKVAGERAQICKAEQAAFEVFDVRNLDTRSDLTESFDVAVCCENIEHIMDDRKLMRDMARSLKPGGRLLLTTPYLLSCNITTEDCGPFSRVEDGGHVRKGYTKVMLEELCNQAGLVPEQISYCSGILSQRLTWLLRRLSKLHPLLGWALVLPMRWIPPFFDQVLTPVIQWPYFTICLEAYKPRYENQ